MYVQFPPLYGPASFVCVDAFVALRTRRKHEVTELHCVPRSKSEARGSDQFPKEEKQLMDTWVSGGRKWGALRKILHALLLSFFFWRAVLGVPAPRLCIVRDVAD